jgi:hypothetical protein
MNFVSQEFGQATTGVVCLYSIISRVSFGKTGMAGANSDF